jgi:hypothetical protein
MHLLLGLDRPIYTLVSTINWPFWTSYALTHIRGRFISVRAQGAVGEQYILW